MDEKIEDVLKLLCSSMKLERHKGVTELEKLMPNLNLSNTRQFQNEVLNLLADTEHPWEIKHGGLLSAKSLISHISLDDDANCNFVLSVKEIAQTLLTDSEAGVRLAAAEILDILCEKIGNEICQSLKDIILKLLTGSLEKNVAEDDISKSQWIPLSSEEKKSNGTPQQFHSIADRKNLETGLRALWSVIEGCGIRFEPFVDKKLLSLVFKSLTYPHFFVREAGFYVCSSLFSCGNTNEDAESRDSVSVADRIYAFGHEFSKNLDLGLADDCSRVRLAASAASRTFLLSLPNNGARQWFYPRLLPQIYLNRYYVPDRVRIYSRETLRQLTGSAGIKLVEQFIGPTVEYYKFATTSGNHAVREAACSCIAELASKISSAAVSPYVDGLLNTLLTCFEDDCWPVRDAACMACGNFVLCFPNESKVAMGWLYPMFYKNLSDPNPSVRQGAAVALCNVVRAYGDEALKAVKLRIVEDLMELKNETSETVKFIGREKGPGKIVTRKRGHGRKFYSDKRPRRYEPQSSKLDTARGYDKTYGREALPWERADGCISLIGELSHIREALEDIVSLVPLLKQVSLNHRYTEHVVFLETLCKQIPVIAKNLGKKYFKMILHDFLDAIFYSLACENVLTSSAASDCLNFIADLLGPNILRVKVQDYNPAYVQPLESVICASL